MALDLQFEFTVGKTSVPCHRCVNLMPLQPHVFLVSGFCTVGKRMEQKSYIPYMHRGNWFQEISGPTTLLL